VDSKSLKQGRPIVVARWIEFNYSTTKTVLVNVDLVLKIERYSYDGADKTQLFFDIENTHHSVVVADKYDRVRTMISAAYIGELETGADSNANQANNDAAR
jgi:hypothetical protein